jgi:hypothetical protein
MEMSDDPNDPHGPSLPEDYAEPNWDEEERVHNWRNHVSEEVMVLWPTFTDEQKQALAKQAQFCADQEEWD